MSKAKTFRFACAVFIAGIALASFVFIPAGAYLFAIMIAFFVLAVISRDKPRARTGFLLAGFFVLGLWRLGLSIPEAGPEEIQYYNGQNVILSGRVAKEPLVSDRSRQITLSVEKLYDQDAEVKGKLLVVNPVYPVYDYGDVLEVSCELKKPEPFEGFAYDRYLARFGIYSTCVYPKIKILQASQNEKISQKALALVLKIKHRAREIVNMGLPEPASGFAGAIVLGDKKGLDQEIKENLSRSGLSHITAISGMHISIFIVLLMFALLSFASRKKAFHIAIFVLFVYIILVGFPASATRAGLMGGLILWAMHIGRLAKPVNSLVFAAALILLFNPKMLRDDIGFQLSFLAVAGILLFYKHFEKFFGDILGKKYKTVFSIINITVCAQLLTAPVIIMNFKQISAMSLLANVLVIWILPVLMALILAAIIAGSILPALSAVLFFPSKLIIDYILSASSLISGFSASVIEFNEPSFVLLAAYILLILALAYLLNLKNNHIKNIRV